MMISPEQYNEENLKGKTVDQIDSQIRSLRRKVRQLQKQIDAPPSQGRMLCPSPQVQLQMYLLYYQKAVEARMDTIEYAFLSGSSGMHT